MEQLKNYTILFAEDDQTISDSFRRILEKIFKKVYHANNGIEALEILENNPVQLILTDIHMPEMDGLELIKKLKASEHADLPIFVTTAYTDINLILTAKELKIDYYFVKPLDIQVLVRESLKIIQHK